MPHSTRFVTQNVIGSIRTGRRGWCLDVLSSRIIEVKESLLKSRSLSILDVILDLPRLGTALGSKGHVSGTRRGG